MYDVMMIDPPWSKTKGGIRKARIKQGRALDYKTLSSDEIRTLLVSNIFPMLLSPGVVFIWTIDQFLWDAEYIMREQGFKLHCRIIWNKLNGVAPAFTIRYSHEYLLWCYKPKLLPIANEMRGKFTDVITERSSKHSQKPDAAYNFINSLYPNTKKLDVFSRRIVEGWHGFGDEYPTDN